MATAKTGDKVRVHYTGTLDDGTEFDSSRERGPIQFTIGEGELIPGFEKAVIGMSVGESKEATVKAKDAYGRRHEELVLEIERERFPEHLTPEVGLQLQIGQPGGRTLIAQVTDVSEEGITLDANHPLAGKDLEFDIQLVEIC